MIIDGTHVIDLSPSRPNAVGANLARPEPDDSQIRIPNVIHPIVEIMRRTTLAPDATTEQQNSFWRELEVTRTNQGAITQNFARLADGRWRIQIQMSSWFNYAGLVGVEGVSVLLAIGGTAVRLLSRYPALNASNLDVVWLDVLALDTFRIQLTNGITGVGESNALRVMVNAAKLV